MIMSKISAEVHFAQLLASNQKRIRDRTLKKVQKWLEYKSSSDAGLTEDGMLKLWKGIYYYFWNLDKPLAQENIAAVISKFIFTLKKSKNVFLFIDTFLQTMTREWFTIDRYRIEKFMMFSRKFLNHCFQFLKQHGWKLKFIKKFRDCLERTVINEDNSTCSLGFKLHIIDIYMEELAKVGAEELTPKQIKCFLMPYVNLLAVSENPTLLKSIQKNIFFYLLDQDVDPDTYGDFPLLKYDAKSICLALKMFIDTDLLKHRNKKIITATIQRFEEPDELEEIEDFDELSKWPKESIKKKTVDKAAKNLLTLDEDFADEKLKWKKKKKCAL